MPRRQSWTDDQLRRAVASSTSIKMTMRTLGISSGGSGHYTIRHRVKELGLDTRHFDSPGALKGSWTDDDLRAVVPRSSGYIDVLGRLGIVPSGGIEKRLKRRISLLGISTMHFVRKRGPRGRKGTRWTDEELRKAVTAARSYAETIRAIGLIPAGGNYDQVKRRIVELRLDVSHFTGQSWNAGGVFRPRPPRSLDEMLVAGRWTTTHNLKKRLLREGLKTSACELCGWCVRSPDGRIPVELDHINGDKTDNRLENLRILCPNCHALQPTHRGLNKQSVRRRS